MEDEFYLELKEGLLEPLAIMERLAIISVVGDGMRTLRGISAKFFAALARANINIVAIAQGSSERSISVVVSNDDATTRNSQKVRGTKTGVLKVVSTLLS